MLCTKYCTIKHTEKSENSINIDLTENEQFKSDFIISFTRHTELIFIRSVVKFKIKPESPRK